MAYGKDVDELLASGDRSVEQVVDTSKDREETEVSEPVEVVKTDANPDVVDTSSQRPADSTTKVKETAGGGLRAVVNEDEDANEVLAKGQDDEAERVTEDGDVEANDDDKTPTATREGGKSARKSRGKKK